MKLIKAASMVISVLIIIFGVVLLIRQIRSGAAIDNARDIMCTGFAIMGLIFNPERKTLL